MPSQHLDNSSRLNLERNLRKSREYNQDVPPWKDYETSTDDPRPIADPELEYEADRSGLVHQRQARSENLVAPGYGINDFGVSSFETRKNSSTPSALIAAGLGLAGFLGWKFRSELRMRLATLSNYALLSFYARKNDDTTSV